MLNWEAKGAAVTNYNGEGPKAFHWKGKYWLIADCWQNGMRVWNSEDCLNWTMQDKPLLGGHGDVNHIYFTALVNGAGLAAELAKGDKRGRVYIVEPTGRFENDPNVTDKEFPGNPTRSYRSKAPLRIVGEVTDWVRQTPEELQKWREKLANSKGGIIN